MADTNLKEYYAVIGELILVSTALDEELNHIVVDVLQLGISPFVLPVVATLDCARKIELLRARLKHLSRQDWKHPLSKFLDGVESVNKRRNIAAHTRLVPEGDKWVFSPLAAAKLLAEIDLNSRAMKPRTTIDDLKQAVSLGEQTLADAAVIRERLRAAIKAKAKRDAAKANK